MNSQNSSESAPQDEKLFVAPVDPENPEKRFVPPQPGEVITSLLTRNTYTIGTKIGEGNFGVVHSCTDVWENNLAVKILKPRGLPYEKVKAAAEAEFLKLVVLRHPNITYIYDAFEYRDTFYIITELCHCTVSDLFTRIPDFKGEVWVMPIARSLLQAIEFVHLQKLVHQDIHAKNVFTTFAKDEMAKPAGHLQAIQFRLADLGIAKLHHEIRANNTRNIGLLPPELLRPEEFGPVDHRIDIYHAGLLLLQAALSKELEFTQEQALSGEPRKLAEKLPPPLNFALGKALRRHAPYRTSSAMELWRDLHGTAAAG